MDDEQKTSHVFFKASSFHGECPFKIPLGSPSSTKDPVPKQTSIEGSISRTRGSSNCQCTSLVFSLTTQGDFEAD